MEVDALLFTIMFPFHVVPTKYILMGSVYADKDGIRYKADVMNVLKEPAGMVDFVSVLSQPVTGA